MSGDSVKPVADDPFSKLVQFKPRDEASQRAQEAVVSEISKDLDKVAEKNGFLSREPAKAEPSAAPKRKRFGSVAPSDPRVQMNMKVPPALKERYYRLAEERGHSELYLLLEEALDTLEKGEPGPEDNAE